MKHCRMCGLTVPDDNPFFDLHIKAHYSFMLERSQKDLAVPEYLREEDPGDEYPISVEHLEKYDRVASGWDCYFGRRGS